MYIESCQFFSIMYEMKEFFVQESKEKKTYKMPQNTVTFALCLIMILLVIIIGGSLGYIYSRRAPDEELKYIFGSLSSYLKTNITGRVVPPGSVNIDQNECECVFI